MLLLELNENMREVQSSPIEIVKPNQNEIQNEHNQHNEQTIAKESEIVKSKLASKTSQTDKFVSTHTQTLMQTLTQTDCKTIIDLTDDQTFKCEKDMYKNAVDILNKFVSVINIDPDDSDKDGIQCEQEITSIAQSPIASKLLQYKYDTKFSVHYKYLVVRNILFLLLLLNILNQGLK